MWQYGNYLTGCGYTGSFNVLPAGYSAGNPPYSTFNITFDYSSSPTGETSSGSNWFNAASNLFNKIYPDEEDLTAKQKWTYIILTMFLTPLIFIIIYILSKGMFPLKIGIWLSVIMGILFFFYFLGIGYIGLGTLVSLVLLFLVIIYLKSRG